MNQTTGARAQLEPLAEAGKLVSSRQRQAILILGMHRSGTSAVAGVISALGVAGPKNLMPPTEQNPRGYFESEPLFVAHEGLLAAAGSRWDDWRQFNPQWLGSKAAEEFRQKIKALLIDEFGAEPLIFVKDPRMCRFFPFMASILAELNVSPVAVLPVRNPLEVAYSLRRRDKFPLLKSLLLWLRHVLDAEFHSRQFRRCFLHYEELLTDWRRCIDRAAKRTGIIWPDLSRRSEAMIDRFLSSDLRHERIEAIDDLPPLARDTYTILMKITAGDESNELLDALDVIRIKFDEDCARDNPGSLSAAE